MRKGWNCLAWRRLRGDSCVKGNSKKDGARRLSVESGDRTMGTNEIQEVLSDPQEILFYSESGWALKQATQRGCWASVHGEVQKLFECGPGVALDIEWPSLSRGTGHDLQWTLPTSTVLWFHDCEYMGVIMLILTLQILCGNRDVWVHSLFLQSLLLNIQVQK